MSLLMPVLGSDFTERLDIAGEAQVLTAGSLRVFDDSQSVWFVTEGSIDLFAVQRKNGCQTGPREHLCSLTAGSLIWGIDQSQNDDGIHLLALSAGETHLLRISCSLVEQLGTDEFLAGPLAKALDNWITGLSQGVTKYITPRQPPRRSIAAGDDIVLEEGERVTSRKNVSWAHLEDGNAFYIDIKEVGGDGQLTLVPLAAQGWLRSGSCRRMSGLSTSAVLQTGQITRHMNSFHGWIYYNLAYGFRNAAASESSRLNRQATQLVSDTENTLIRFARFFDSKYHRKVEAKPDDALFNCCAIIGKAMSISMVLPAFARRRRAEEQPVTISDISSASHLQVRQVALSGRWWAAENGPMVGYRKDGMRPVALLQQSPTVMVLHDPSTGIEQIVTESVAESLSPTAHTFYAGLPTRPASPWDLLDLCFKQCRADLIAIIAAGALGGLIAAAIPMATGYVFDAVIPGHQTFQMMQVALAITAAAFAAAAFEFSRDVAQLRVEGRISGIVQAAFMDRLLRLPAAFFANYSSGDLAQRTMMVEMARKSLTGVVLGSLVSGAFSLFSFALLIYYAPFAALAAILLVIIFATVTVATSIRLMNAMMGVQETAGKINSLVLDIITGITKLRMAGAEERAFNNWGTEFGEMRSRTISTRRILSRFSVFWAAYEILCLAGIFATISLIGDSGMTTGAFLAFVAAFNGLLVSIFALARSLVAVFSVVPLYQRASPILKTTPENDVTKADPGSLNGDLEINNVFFRYAANLPNVLHGLTMKIDAGELIAVVGPSGSGKSTLMRLLLGLDRPEGGAIYFDGRDLQGLNPRSVRRQIGVVMQKGRLMPGSIYENIKGATRATVDDCWEAATKVGLAEDITSMPMQMHTLLTDGAAALSGGQVQRLLIARAMVGKPAILLLDEATSALDNKTQSVVMDSLGRLSVTRIVIAHRLSTIMNADRIYVLKNGRVVESGSYEQLMEKGGEFSALAHRQCL